MEKQELMDYLKKCRKQTDLSYSFAKYECHRYFSIINHEGVLQTAFETLRQQANFNDDLKNQELDIS